MKGKGSWTRSSGSTLSWCSEVLFKSK